MRKYSSILAAFCALFFLAAFSDRAMAEDFVTPNRTTMTQFLLRYSALNIYNDDVIDA